MHVLTPAVHKHLTALFRAGGTVNFRNALSALASQERYLASELEGRRYDFGVKYGLLNAQLALAISGTDRDEVLRNIVELLATKSR
jgi:UTP--glucose-1-phosphate uridylyltransferase